jgi:hypothetical protein
VWRIAAADRRLRSVRPRKSISRLGGVIILLAVTLSAPPIGASPDGVSNGNPWRCDGHLLPDFNMSPSDAGGSQEAISYLYVGARGLKSDYLSAATFTLPRTSLRRGWYANSIVLKPMADDRVFASLMLVRNKRFHFAEHVAVAWATPHATDVSYKDTNLVYPDPGGPHRLGISVTGDLLSLYVDGQTICTARSSRFVEADAIKWFQVRTETNEPGYHGSGTVHSIVLKRDDEASPKAYPIHCEWHGSGVSWFPLGNGSFRAGGAFYRNEATYVDGAEPGSKCTGVVR